MKTILLALLSLVMVATAADPVPFLNTKGSNIPEDHKATLRGNIGLGNVANTAPADLPVSTATQAALDLVASKAGMKMFFPEDDGAVGDGTTDDTEAIQTCYDRALISSWRGIVFCGRGYRVTDTIVTAGSYVSWMGTTGGAVHDEGTCRSGLIADMSNKPVILLNEPQPSGPPASKGVIFENFSIVGTSSAGKVSGTIGIKITRTSFGTGSAGSDCVRLVGMNLQWLGQGFYSEGCDSPTVVNSRICDNGKGLYFKNSINSAVTAGCIIFDNSTYGVMYDGNCRGGQNNGQYGRNGIDIDVVNLANGPLHLGPGTIQNDNVATAELRSGGIRIHGKNVHVTGWTIVAQGNATPTNRYWSQAAIKVVGNSEKISITNNHIELTGNIPAFWMADTTSQVNFAGNFCANPTAIPLKTDSGTSGISWDPFSNKTIATATNSIAAGTLAPHNLSTVASYADNAAAIMGPMGTGVGGLRDGDFYRNGADLKLVVYDATAQIYVAGLVAEGVTVTGAQRVLISNFIAAQKTAGRWPTNGRLYLRGWANAEANRVDMLTGTKLGTWEGANITHAAGYVQNTVSSYFDYGVSPATLGLTANSSSIGALVYQESAGSFYCAIMGNGSGGNALQLLEDADADAGDLEFYGYSAQVPDLAGGNGIIIGTRTGASAQAIYRRASGGFTTQSNTTAVGTPATTNLELMRRGAGSPLPHNGRIGLDFAFPGMDSTAATAFSADLKTLWEGLYSLSIP